MVDMCYQEYFYYRCGHPDDDSKANTYHSPACKKRHKQKGIPITLAETETCDKDASFEHMIFRGTCCSLECCSDAIQKRVDLWAAKLKYEWCLDSLPEYLRDLDSCD